MKIQLQETSTQGTHASDNKSTNKDSENIHDNVVDKQEKSEESDEKMPNENDMKMETAGSQLDKKMMRLLINLWPKTARN